MLAQKQEDGTIWPVAYASRTLQPHERNYGATELEALGVAWAVKNFNIICMGITATCGCSFFFFGDGSISSCTLTEDLGL